MGLEKLRCDVPCGTTQSYFHPMAKRAKGTKVKFVFQGLHMTHVIFVFVYKFKVCILDTLFNTTC